MNNQTLINAGFSPEQSEIYLSLLDHGPQTAISLAKTTKVKRTYVYKICQELASQSYITIEQKGRTTFFIPLSPNIIINKLSEKKTQIESAQISIEHLLPSLLTKYNTLDTKPHISYFEGASGIHKVYSSIIQDKKDLVFFRPKHNLVYKKYKKIMKNYVKQQVENKIHTRAITPFNSVSKENFLQTDSKNLITRHFTQNNNFIFPCQIMVFSDKVAIISFEEPTITTFIENKKISQTFKQIFDLLWEATDSEHQKIIDSW